MTPRVKEQYLKEVRPALVEKFGYKNPNQIPKIDKITVNIGVGEASQSPNLMEDAVKTLRQITGQHPSVRKATKSIANFKLREGMPVGCMVTLRETRMYEFWDRLINTAIPQIRDFRGMPNKGFDGRGNYTMGIREQIVFPEINIDKVAKIRGMNISVVTTAKTDEEGMELLTLLKFPFRKN